MIELCVYRYIQLFERLCLIVSAYKYTLIGRVNQMGKENRAFKVQLNRLTLTSKDSWVEHMEHLDLYNIL